jgi:hypothetical protein
MRDGADSNHPAGWALDAVAAGDAASDVETHLAGCDACARYVATVRGEAEGFRARADASSFAATVHARAKGTRPPRRANVLWVAAPALAAAVALVAWPTRSPVSPGVDPTVASEHFKGGLTIAVVREREGRQDRLTEPFEIEPGDRIRLEVSVDHERPVAGGLLSSDGTWAVLLAPVPVGAGTHYSELAARFDEEPTDAFLLVGAPEDVDRARATRNFDAVIAWHVRSAPRR